jgi:hypothetical protein
MMYWSLVSGRGSESEVGSLMMYWSYNQRGVSYGWSIGMGNGRSEWEQVTMKGKSFWWAWLWIITTTTQVQDARGVEAREEESELPSSGSQEAALLPRLTFVLSSPTSHTLVSLSLEAISVHSSIQSSHPLAGLTLPPPTWEALAIAHLERTLVLVRSAVTKATPSSSYTT